MRRLLGRTRRLIRKPKVRMSIPGLRLVGPGVTLFGLLALLFSLLTGRIDLPSLDSLSSLNPDTAAESPIAPVKLETLRERSDETIRIATFNIKMFGKTKAGNAEVLRRLAQIVAQFDIVALQEVRGGDATPIIALVNLLRASGGQYNATLSEPLGRSPQKESYAFIWDESRIHLVPDSAYVVQDPADRLEREPMVATFETRAKFSDGRQPFRCTLINVHTKPSDVVPSALNNEMNVLDDVFNSVRNYEYQANGEEDFILLGDLNVDTGHMFELGQVPGIVSVAGQLKTNTLGTKTYDHVMIDQTLTREFTARAGVLDLQRDLAMTPEQAMEVSDHQPVWAEFSIHELPRFDPVAATPAVITR